LKVGNAIGIFELPEGMAVIAGLPVRGDGDKEGRRGGGRRQKGRGGTSIEVGEAAAAKLADVAAAVVVVMDTVAVAVATF
jgi:hypothetical protein